MASVLNKLCWLKCRPSSALGLRRICQYKNLWSEQSICTTEDLTALEQSIYLEPAEEIEHKDFFKCVSVLDEQEILTDVSHIGPDQGFRTFNFATFANNVPILKKLVDLGVDFNLLEQKKHKPHYLLKLTEEDITPYIQFLINRGVPVEVLGEFFTYNSFFFLNDLSDLQIRVNYLESKKFTSEAITKMIIGNPLWLNYSTKLIDLKLGNLQRTFRMTGYEVRLTVLKYSRLINYGRTRLTESMFELIDVNEFTLDQCREMATKCPAIYYQLERHALKERVEYLLIDMDIPRELIVADPSVLRCRKNRVESRHIFLKKLGRAQYDPKKPNYVPLKVLCVTDDAAFCQDIAKTSMETFNLFLKTL